jgi:two-component system, LytTR family, response regulator
MKAIIIDDDPINITLLEMLLQTYAKEVKVLATANTLEDTLQLIQQNEPEIVFLDIEVHNKNARDILPLIDTSTIQVILISAYEQYAIEMYEYNVCSYVLKPIEITKLVAAIQKAKTSLANLKNKVANTNSDMQYITVQGNNAAILVSIDNILRIEAQRNYCKIITTDGKVHNANKSLKEYENNLPSEKFTRVHHSHIVQWKHVAKYIRSRSGVLELTNGELIPISASKKAEVSAKIIL